NQFVNQGPPSRAARVLPWLLGLGSSLLYLALLLGLQYARVGLFAFAVMVLGSLLLFVTHGYGRADPVLRRRVRWVVYGLYCAFTPAILTLVAASIEPRLLLWFLYARLAFIAIPVSILIAIVRYDLFDVDRLISTTFSYNIVLVVIVGVGLALVPPA